MRPREDYTRKKMRGVPVDDDTIYTLLGLLIAEEHGTDFFAADGGASGGKVSTFGMDNDCTTATAGSIVGSVIG